MAAACLVWLAADAREARADLVWEPVGPVPMGDGMTAVESDPDDPNVFWIASASSVWVSDDGGESFRLVLQLSRATAIGRETGAGVTIESDPDPLDTPTEGTDIDPDHEVVDPETGEVVDSDDYTDVDDPDGYDEELYEPAEVDPDTGLPVDEEPEAVETTGDDGDAGGALLTADGGGGEDPRFGISRLRVVGDVVVVCTGRGAWTLPREARRIGSGQELRFGRRVAVNDAAPDAQGRIMLGTDRGLLQIGSDGVARRVGLADDETPVLSLTLLGQRLVVGRQDGILIDSDVGLVPLGVSLRERVGDLVALSDSQLLVAAAEQVALVLAEPGGAATVEQSWQVPGVLRIAIGREGSLFAVGSSGAWEYREDSGWLRRDEGLIDRRLADVASSASGPSFLYIVGRAGAARLVPEQERIWSTRARFQAQRALEGMPTAEETIAWAQAARQIQPEDADALKLERSLAWLLPRVQVHFLLNRRRYENLLFIPVLERRILDQVRVVPDYEQFRVEARWDLMPALLVALGGTDSQVRALELAAIRASERVRDTVNPLYQAWVRKRIDLVAGQFRSPRDAVRELLTVQQLEADLYVYTAGRFPIVGVTDVAGGAARD